MVSKEELILKAQTRQQRGKKHLAKMRKDGKIPAIFVFDALINYQETRAPGRSV